MAAPAHPTIGVTSSRLRRMGLARGRGTLVAWVVALLAFGIVWQTADLYAPWAQDYPKTWMVPAARWVSAFMKWLVNPASFGLVSFTELDRLLRPVVGA